MSQGLLLRFIKNKSVSLTHEQVRMLYWLGFDSGRVYGKKGILFQEYGEYFLEDAKRVKSADKKLATLMRKVGWK